MLYRVLIVDDEPWVAYGISRLIDWEREGFEIIGEALDGISAAQWIRERRPDVVISDIRMPGLDGLELLEEIRRQRSDAEVIFVSGYSEFEYAQRALRLGAFDYLLKQIDKDMLLDAMIRLRGRLDRKRRDSLEADAIFGDLFDLLDSDSEEEIGAFYAGKAKALYPHYRIVNALYPADDEFGAAGELVEAKGISGFAIRTGMHKQTILLNSDDSDPNALANFVDERLSAAAHIGISCAGLADASLSRLYREADVALYTSVFYPQLRLAHYRENAPIAGAAGLLLQLELGIREQKPDSVTRCLRELSEACLNQKPFVDQVAGLCNQIVSLVQKYYGSDGGPHPVEFLSYSQLGKSGRSAEELFERLRAFMDREAAPDIPIVHEQVKSVMAYIDARFTEDLMLGAIAKQFNVSLGYLSYLLKRETGKTFSEYIAYRRIALAKELLADGSLSVQEIVQRVGYKDYFHFNKLFKKHVGVTPSKFRKL